MKWKMGALLCLAATPLLPICSQAAGSNEAPTTSSRQRALAQKIVANDPLCQVAYKAAGFAADSIRVWNWIRSRPSNLWNWSWLSGKINRPDMDEITKILARLHRNPVYYAQQKKFSETEALAIAIFAESRKPETGRDILEIIRSGSASDKRALDKALDIIRKPGKLNDRTLGQYASALQDIANPYPVDMAALLKKGVVDHETTWHATQDLVAEIGYKRAFLEMGLGRWTSPSTTRVLWEDARKAVPKIAVAAVNAASLRSGNFLVYAPRLNLVRNKLLEIIPKYYDRIAVEGLEKVMPEIQKEIGTSWGLPTGALDAFYNNFARAFNVAAYTYILTVLVPPAIPKARRAIDDAYEQYLKELAEIKKQEKAAIEAQKGFLLIFSGTDEFLKKRLSEISEEIKKTSPEGSPDYVRRMNIAAEQLQAIKEKAAKRRAEREKQARDANNSNQTN